MSPQTAATRQGRDSECAGLQGLTAVRALSSQQFPETQAKNKRGCWGEQRETQTSSGLRGRRMGYDYTNLCCKYAEDQATLSAIFSHRGKAEQALQPAPRPLTAVCKESWESERLEPLKSIRTKARCSFGSLCPGNRHPGDFCNHPRSLTDAGCQRRGCWRTEPD